MLSAVLGSKIYQAEIHAAGNLFAVLVGSIPFAAQGCVADIGKRIQTVVIQFYRAFRCIIRVELQTAAHS